ncbi:MAG: glycosyltransferase, partial [Eubacterium sp.]|nr:glycosyltransferase [Eubacterium sp.]
VGIKNQLKKLMRPLIKYAATDYWGCSNAAGKFYFSEKYWNKAHEFIRNAIEVDNFTFNSEIRKTIRDEYGFGDKLVIGHVGRMAPQKNQKKLIDVFNEIHKVNPETHLVIIGTGELEEKLKQQVKDLGLSQAATFTGVLSNVNEWYSAIDVFVMTSLYEGLPVVAVEAQAADLPCVLTDTITPEVKVTEKVSFLGLNDDSKKWANEILSIKPGERVPRKEELKNAGYDINTEAKRMQDLYLELYSKIQEG